MSKNILIFSDGTGQAGGLTPDQRLSNIYKLFRAARVHADNSIDPARQVAFYDPGLGTGSDEGSIKIAFLKSIRKTLSSATGTGISRNIIECYEAIIKHYEPGDRVYLFGFSRGAYTARCVAGVMNLCGVPTTGANGADLPRRGPALREIAQEAVRNVYEHGAGWERSKFEAEREEQARRFRAKYGSVIEGKANVVPYFIGVFDTVASLGAAGAKMWLLRSLLLAGTFLSAMAAAWAVERFLQLPYWPTVLFFSLLIFAVVVFASLSSSLRIIRDFPEKGDIRMHLASWKSAFYDRYLDPRVRFARHALAIDETRANFQRVQWGSKRSLPATVANEPEWLKQIWFAGNHSDIGGSYPEDESRLSDISLKWMLEEALSLPNPIEIDNEKLNLYPLASGMQHSEVESVRDMWPSWWPHALRWTWHEKSRVDARGAPLHESVFERFNLAGVLQHDTVKPYRPATLVKDERVASLYTTSSNSQTVATLHTTPTA